MPTWSHAAHLLIPTMVFCLIKNVAFSAELCQEHLWELQSSNKSWSYWDVIKAKRPSVEAGEGDRVKGRPDLFSGSTTVISTSSQPVVLVSKTASEALVYPSVSVTTIKQRLFTPMAVKGNVYYSIAQQSSCSNEYRLICCSFRSCAVDLHESWSDFGSGKKDNIFTSTLFLEQLMQNRCFKWVCFFMINRTIGSLWII